MQVDTLHPLEISAPATVVNTGHVAVYYKGASTVSAASHDGELAAGASLEITQTTWFIASAAAAQIDYAQQTIGSGAYIATSAKGAVSGVAALDAHGVVQSATSGSYNAALGAGALAVNTAPANTAVGVNALAANTAEGNTAVGTYALAANTAGEENTAVGVNALAANSTGNLNTAVGRLSMQDNTSGSANTAIGCETLKANTTGAQNTAVGGACLQANTTGERNTGIGGACLEQVTSGKRNVSVGMESGSRVQTGEHNTLLGYGAGQHLSGKSGGNICIGYEAGLTETAEHSNELFIHNAASSEPLIWGQFTNRELRLYTTKLGFFGVTPVAKPAKAETVEGIYKALKELGLMA